MNLKNRNFFGHFQERFISLSKQIFNIPTLNSKVTNLEPTVDQFFAVGKTIDNYITSTLKITTKIKLERFLKPVSMRLKSPH